MSASGRSPAGTSLKFGIFAAVMLMLSASLFFIFGQFRNGPTHGYSAIFIDASQLKAGDSVRRGRNSSRHGQRRVAAAG